MRCQSQGRDTGLKICRNCCINNTERANTRKLLFQCHFLSCGWVLLRMGFWIPRAAKTFAYSWLISMFIHSACSYNFLQPQAEQYYSIISFTKVCFIYNKFLSRYHDHYITMERMFSTILQFSRMMMMSRDQILVVLRVSRLNELLVFETLNCTMQLLCKD